MCIAVSAVLCYCALSVDSSGSSRLHKHETIYNDTPARRSHDVRHKTYWNTQYVSFSGVNHPYGSRHRLSPTYRYHNGLRPHAARPAAPRLFALTSLPPPRVCLLALKINLVRFENFKSLYSIRTSLSLQPTSWFMSSASRDPVSFISTCFHTDIRQFIPFIITTLIIFHHFEQCFTPDNNLRVPSDGLMSRTLSLFLPLRICNALRFLGRPTIVGRLYILPRSYIFTFLPDRQFLRPRNGTAISQKYIRVWVPGRAQN